MRDPGLDESVFLRTCRGEALDHPPVWFMRQAGRSLPEYRKVREGVAMLDACRDPALVTEITLQPVRRYGVDAAILFSDIVIPLLLAGVALDITPGVGPVIERPIRTEADLDQLRPLDDADTGFISEAIGLLTAELGATPLIGFAGAPFTLASYLVEGGPSRNHEHTKALMYGAPALWQELMRRLADIQATWLRTQIAAGASAIQLFDSWVGAVSAADYARHVLPHSARVLAAVGESGVPRIHFGVGTGELLALMGEAGADIVGVDFRLSLDEAARRVGAGRGLQGNLDPAVLFAPWDVVEAQVREVVAAGRRAQMVTGAGHVFNLGHGVIPETDPDVLARVVELVHGTAP